VWWLGSVESPDFSTVHFLHSPRVSGFPPTACVFCCRSGADRPVSQCVVTRAVSQCVVTKGLNFRPLGDRGMEPIIVTAFKGNHKKELGRGSFDPKSALR
jgi:hypothetical protein